MVAQAAAEVKNMQEELQKRKDENTCYVDKIFQEITITLTERKQQILNEINKTTADKMQSLNKQHEDLTELQLQMNAYLELVDVKLKSGRDQDIMTMKDQMVNRGDTLLQVARLAKTSPVETVPSKFEFPCLENIKGLIKVLGMSFNSNTCNLQLDEMPSFWNALLQRTVFKVTAKDLSGQPVLNCSSLLEVKVFPNENSKANVEQPTVTDNGDGCYNFSTGSSSFFSVQKNQLSHKHMERQQKYGLASVKVFGKNIQGSPLR